MELLFLLGLISMNGLFAMSEIAVVSARRSRLQGLADGGSAGARAAILLQERPGGFLSTIQVGITSVGIMSGAIGEAALADPLRQWLAKVPLLAPSADVLALVLVVAAITYLTVVVGELAPKQLALLAPETIAARVSRPLGILSRAALPLVWLLSTSSALLLRAVGARRDVEPPVTDEEIKVLMAQGAEAGVFHASEAPIVANVLRLDEQPIGAIMTPRNDVYYLDLADDVQAIRLELTQAPHSLVPVCRGGLDGPMLGVLKLVELLPRCLAGVDLRPEELEAQLHPPLFVPESLTTTQLLESFRASRVNLALIVDEYGSLEGLVTLDDVLTSIVGVPVGDDVREAPALVPRDDGTWLADGALSLERLRAELGLDEVLPGEDEKSFHTVGGLVMHRLGRVPRETDTVDAAGLRFEVVDMDRQRVDKLLIARLPGAVDDDPV
jgi:putative hemolysin